MSPTFCMQMISRSCRPALQAFRISSMQHCNSGRLLVYLSAARKALFCLCVFRSVIPISPGPVVHPPCQQFLKSSTLVCISGQSMVRCSRCVTGKLGCGVFGLPFAGSMPGSAASHPFCRDPGGSNSGSMACSSSSGSLACSFSQFLEFFWYSAYTYLFYALWQSIVREYQSSSSGWFMDLFARLQEVGCPLPLVSSPGLICISLLLQRLELTGRSCYTPVMHACLSPRVFPSRGILLCTYLHWF